MDSEAINRAIDLSDRLERDLASDRGGPITAMAIQARNEAVNAVRALITADAEEPKLIRALQNEIARYVDMAHWLASFIDMGREAWGEVSVGEREELRTALRLAAETQEIDDR